MPQNRSLIYNPLFAGPVLRKKFKAGPDGVRVTKVDGQTFVDFRGWASKVFKGDSLPEGFQVSLVGVIGTNAHRRIHINQLKSHMHVDDTLHHMKQFNEYQSVPAVIHELFKPHHGIEGWGL